MKRTKFLIIFLSVFIICVIFACAQFSSASVVSEGRSGAAVGELFVYGRKGFGSEYVKITVDMKSMPLGEDGEYNESYDGRVRLETSLYNSSSVDSNVKIYFHEKTPGYGDLSKDRRIYLDGELLPQRKSYVLSYGNSAVSDKYIEAVTGITDPDEAISPEEKVYVYKYYLSASDENTAIYLTGYDGGFPVIAKGARSFKYVKNNVEANFYTVETGDNSLVTVASVGRPLDVEDWKAAETLDKALNGEYLDCGITQRGYEETSYKDYVKGNLNCPDEGKDDLYACVTSKLNGASFVEEDDIFASRSYACISIVDVTVPAGERVVFAVDERVFPGIMKNYSPPVYVLEVKVPFFNSGIPDFYTETTINTPYSIIDSNLDLTRSGYSYTVRTEKYSGSNLTVKLCASDDPESLPTEAQAAFLTLLYLMGLSPTVRAIVIVVSVIIAVLLAVCITALVEGLIKLIKRRSEY